MRVHLLFIASFACLSVSPPRVSGEVFTALATLTKSLFNQKELAGALRQYVEAEKLRLAKVSELAKDYDDHADRSLVNPESYLANPINAYLFVKRFTTELEAAKSLLSSESNTNAYLDQLSTRQDSLPTKEDLDGVVAALLRLQDTYELPAHQVAEGTFTPVNRSPKLTANDCYFLGMHSYSNKDWYHTTIWMQEALDQWQGETNKTVSKELLLDYLSYATAMQGNLVRAMKLTEEILQLNPDHTRARNNLRYFEAELKKQSEDLQSKGLPPHNRADVPTLINPRLVDAYRQGAEFKRYEALCRGEDVMPNPYQHKLKCYYTNMNRDPILLLAPVKVEEFYKDPLLVLYYDVISDAEIEIVKNLSTPKLQRAVVNDPATGKLVTATYRISRSAWLDDADHPTIATITRRISAVTHLSMETVEQLQVVNYGIAGQYEPHYDFARPEDAHQFEESRGNRVATWIYYLSDVDAGGLTVFTSIGVKVPPIKGSAAFWWNLKKSGEGDLRTRHAGCPVLAGSKWVANKWMRERGQEFMRPCGLSTNE